MLMAAENGSNFWALCMFGVQYIILTAWAKGGGPRARPSPSVTRVDRPILLHRSSVWAWFVAVGGLNSSIWKPHGSQSVVLLGDAA